jgi:hypothetical protein
MANRQELEQVNIIQLAVLCQRMADDPTVDELIAHKAQKLKREWVVLVGRDTPPPPDFKMHQQVQKEMAELKERMVQFLSTV